MGRVSDEVTPSCGVCGANRTGRGNHSCKSQTTTTRHVCRKLMAAVDFKQSAVLKLEIRKECPEDSDCLDGGWVSGRATNGNDISVPYARTAHGMPCTGVWCYYQCRVFRFIYFESQPNVFACASMADCRDRNLSAWEAVPIVARRK
jgi:hypothetical protein